MEGVRDEKEMVKEEKGEEKDRILESMGKNTIPFNRYLAKYIKISIERRSGKQRIKYLKIRRY